MQQDVIRRTEAMLARGASLDPLDAALLRTLTDRETRVRELMAEFVAPRR